MYGMLNEISIWIEKNASIKEKKVLNVYFIYTHTKYQKTTSTYKL